MPLRVTVELISRGNEAEKSKVCIVNVRNDGTGTHDCGNYIVDAEGICHVEGEYVGWDSWADFPKRLMGVQRSKGHVHLACEAMKIVMPNPAMTDKEEKKH